MAAKTTSKPRKQNKPRRLSPTTRPGGLTLEQWQRELRRQHAAESPLRVRRIGEEPVFSDFSVHNPQSQRTYRVAIRGDSPGVNFCSCPDYAVNTLGTCKHVEAVLAQLRKRHKTELKNGYHPPFSEVYVQYGDRRSLRFSSGLDCPSSVWTVAGRGFDADGLAKDSAVEIIDKLVAAARREGHDLRIYDDALELIADHRDGVIRRRRIDDRYVGRSANAAWKKLLKANLFPYQREGALFAARAGRVLIADEMGLGKTVQAIAATELLAREFGLERALVICPTSLKGQWASEIEKFAGRSSIIIEGLTHHRRRLYEQAGELFKITNYDVVHRDLDAITAYGPELVILDEAQRIKNWQTRAAKAVKQVRSRYAIVLTGTPLENRIDELHSIVEYVDRFRLGPLFAFKAAHEVFEKDSTRVVGYQGLDRITRTLEPILIRRTKDEVLKQLPPRMDKNFFVPMTPQQWAYHHENRDIVAKLVSKWRKLKFLTEADQLRLRIALQNMRMACDSTYLLDQETRHGNKIGDLASLLEEILERPDQKVVIFSQWLRMNHLVEEMLAERGWRHVHLHGGVASRNRKDLVRALHDDDDCRVFLSTDAGGVGLNLQRAATVINMDLPWNPAVLEQRIARVHRMGQKEPVRVVNFIAEHAIEQGMLSLLAFKQSVFAGVLDGAAESVMMGDSALNRFMKTVETATSAVQSHPSTATEPDDGNGRVADRDDSDRDVMASASAPIAEGPAGLTPRPDATRARPAASDGAADPAGVLGELLVQGAGFLASLAEALRGRADSGSPAGGGVKHDDGDRNLRPRVAIDPDSGRPELRIALPDPAALADLTERFMSLLQPPRGR